MKFSIFILILTLFQYTGYTQSLCTVYPVVDLGSVEVRQDSVIKINNIPFVVNYLIEFNEDTFVNTVTIDRVVDNFKLTTFVNGRWVSFPMLNDQTFEIDTKVKYLLLEYYTTEEKVYILIE